MDVHSKRTRSFNMSRIRAQNTKPELLIRKLLWSHNYRYRLQKKDLPGKPDIVFPERRKVVFINGCFWHKHDCKHFKWPKTNVEFWREKIEGNVSRDLKNYERLQAMGWQYFIVWECELRNEGDRLQLWNHLKDFLDHPSAL